MNGALEQHQYRLYFSRWLQLAIFSLATASNALLWTTLAPISTDSETYFDMSSTNINLVALSFQILYLPGTIAASYMVKSGGLRSPILYGTLLTFVGALLRYVAVLVLPKTPAFYMLLLGQSLCALGQPCFVNAPGLLSSNWFGVAERDVATTVASLFAVVGNAVGQIMPPALVSSDSKGKINGIESLLLVQTIIPAVPFVLTVLFFKSHPPTPPSSSTENRDLLHHASSAETSKPLLDSGRPSSTSDTPSTYSVSSDALSLLSNRPYRVLLVSFGLGLALFNALLTVLNNILSPCGYSEDDAGNFAAVLIGAGLVGAGFAGYLMDTYHLYRPILKGGFTLAFLTTLALSFAITPTTPTPMYFTFAVLGFSMIPQLPCIIENAIETTYPVSEELSTGILFTTGNVIGIPVTFFMQYLIDIGQDKCGEFLAPVNILIMSVAAVCCLTVLQYHGEYKRLAADRAGEGAMSIP